MQQQQRRQPWPPHVLGFSELGAWEGKKEGKKERKRVRNLISKEKATVSAQSSELQCVC